MYGYTKMELRALSKQEHLARHKREALLSESYNLNLWLPTKLTYYNKKGGISCLQLCKKKKWREIEGPHSDSTVLEVARKLKSR